MIIKKILFENFKNLKNFELSLASDVVLLDEVFNNCDVKMWKSDFFSGAKFVFNVFCEENDFALILNEQSKNSLKYGLTQIEKVRVAVEFQADENCFVLEKIATYHLCDNFVKLKDVQLLLNSKPLQINEHCDFCAQFYNHAFAFVSFLKKKTYGENLSRELWMDRFISLLHFVDVDKEREQINKEMKHFKIAKKQLFLQLDEDNVPQWHKPKGGLYLNGDYSQMEDVLRFAYYHLALNKFLSKKFNRNLPIFVEDILSYLDEPAKMEFQKTLKTNFKNQVIYG